jgi:[acyl-carrier-protein] S-malonyltransferase
MRTALVFPGQASQYVGMAADWAEAHEFAAKMWKRADEVLDMPLSRTAFEGPTETLTQTAYTQPAIFVHSAIVLSALRERGFAYDVVAGHSLGEYAALVAADVLDFESALTAVMHRSRLMQAACDANPGTMAAIVGLEFSTVSDVCEKTDGIVAIANVNSPGQVAISGETAAVKAAGERLKETGAKRVIPLPVGGAYHSPLMASAGEGLALVLDGLAFNPPRVPVVPNVTAVAERDPDRLKQLLVEQITSPVLWTQTLTTMKESGCERFVEVGPGNVLQGLTKRTLGRDVANVGVDHPGDIDRADT